MIGEVVEEEVRGGKRRRRRKIRGIPWTMALAHAGAPVAIFQWKMPLHNTIRLFYRFFGSPVELSHRAIIIRLRLTV